MVESLQVLVTGVRKNLSRTRSKQAGGVLIVPPAGGREGKGRALPLPRARRPARLGSGAPDPVNQSHSIGAAPLDGSLSVVKQSSWWDHSGEAPELIRIRAAPLGMPGLHGPQRGCCCPPPWCRRRRKR
jgi:hypothetical protein